ncbi:unnamed protein product [Psylliodes chrysocephalus]|uniref:RING-type E3 ubiquitin transferase n=1 Tax=Psylliodes chrysocephalus TaxID=3402493 RepID=A0A9P0CPM0_9CUCU|nr:unnamed protein product [Psylliodes chrysocephala]
MSQIQNIIVFDNVCDYCHKSLSVTPVKVYPNRRIKCGRCSKCNNEEEDNGVDSMYNQIASRIFFDCINKFDGCTQFLQSCEVVEHEKICLSKMCTCPICLEEMFTFLMIRHFKINHRGSLLEKPHFQVTDLKNIEKTLLYQLESDLLFVNFRDVSDSSADDLRQFSLNFLLYLGKNDNIKNFKVDFFEKNTYILDKTIDTSGSTSVTYNITLNITHESKLLIMFHLNNAESKIALINVKQHQINKSEEKENNNLKSLPQNNSDPKIVHNKMGENLKTLLFQKRDICVSETFKKPVTDLVITDKTTISFAKSGKKFTITLACYDCPLIYFSYNQIKAPYYTYLIENNDNNYYMKCFRCNNYLDTENKVKEEGFTRDELDKLKFFCVWGCGTLCVYNELYKHERNCNKQIYQKCPVQSCFHYLKLYAIEQHVAKEHSLVICQSINSYNFNESLIRLNLNTSKSVLEHIMFMWCVCVFVKFKWEQPNWTISFTCEIPGIEIKAGIYGLDKKEITTIIESGSIPHYDSMYVHLRCNKLLKTTNIE